MNREEFITYLKNPLRLDKKSLPEFNEVLEEFPFFQTGHLLYLKNLYNLDHIRYGTQLKKSAAFINNREVLYRLISLSPGKTETQSSTEIRSTPEKIEKADNKMDLKPPVESRQKEITPFIEKEEKKTKRPKKEKEKVVTEKLKPKETDEGPRSREELAREIRERLAEIQGHKSEPDKPTPPLGSPVSKLAKPSHTEPGDIIQLDDSQPVESGPVTGSDSDKILIDQKSKGKTDLLDLDYPGKETDKPKSNKQIPKTGEPSVSKISGSAGPEKKNLNNKETARKWGHVHSFTSWLKLLEPSENTLIVPESDTNSGKQLYQQNLIDRFIENSPRILPDTSEFKINEDISKDSIVEKEELFSETLAEIYVNQGYYSRAIFIYKKLSLKFPEKSSYFARQIQNVEQRLKDF